MGSGNFYLTTFLIKKISNRMRLFRTHAPQPTSRRDISNKYWIVICISLMVLSACGVKEQADQMQALEKCEYDVVSADSVSLAGIDINKIIGTKGLNIYRAPRLAFAYMQGSVPLRGALGLKITNNGAGIAAINNFDYKILIGSTEILSGTIDKRIEVVPDGGSTFIPIKIDKDIYPLISNPENQRAVNKFLTSKTPDSTRILIKIKPRIFIGDKSIEYPSYIDIVKTFTNVELFSYLKKLE